MCRGPIPYPGPDHGEEPVDKQRLQPLVRVLVNMIVRLSATGLSFEGGMPKPNFSHRLLLMLDEFPSLGKLDILQESLAFLPGYGIKAYLIAQDINHKAHRANHRGERASHHERTRLVDQCEPFNARSIASPAHSR